MFTQQSKLRLNAYVPSHIAKRAKAQALVKGTSVSEIVEEALTKYLPAITKIEFARATDEDMRNGGGVKIEYAEEELAMLEKQALLDHKEGKTTSITSEKELDEYLDRLDGEAAQNDYA